MNELGGMLHLGLIILALCGLLVHFYVLLERARNERDAARVDCLRLRRRARWLEGELVRARWLGKARKV